jgi:signal transduction histidine kinase
MAQVGTGLGLSIVKAMVEQHGGCLEVQSEQGKGSCFRVLLNKYAPP